MGKRGTRSGLRRGRAKVARPGHGGPSLHSATGNVGAFSARSGGGRGGGGYRGFKSKKQWRWAYATHQPWARKKAHETKGGKITRYRRLPASKHSGHKGSRVPKA
ncbi:hypothetical protein AVJ28_gp75 [Mycobacterium phage Baee]|uniref:Uncharacterized protein n=2 Tax=Acadianvirus baee TaxID=1982902 RepID=A0A1L6BZ18_9CAUD|nr:hypothetical protein AVJ28_gp75 [Mycobacterium phage Baee]AKF14644.1 hypothetical protein SEA_BAEE_75 [Mycobacterium phage Baee]APQ42333.1 hypothetical protein PBI_RICH_74 [Mycobacterium phage Rich]